MKVTILKNGFVKITANNEDRAELKYAYEQGGYPQADDYVRECLTNLYWEFVQPEWVSALTNAPIITNDIVFGENGDCYFPTNIGDVWWFPSYMLKDPWEALKNKGRVIFEPEENNKSLPK